MAGKRIEKTFQTDVKKLTDSELGLELKSLKTKLFSLRSQSVTEKVEDLSQFGQTKRNIARVLTEQKSRTLAKAK
jgi:ribosomal protein L29